MITLIFENKYAKHYFSHQDAKIAESFDSAISLASLLEIDMALRCTFSDNNRTIALTSLIAL